jgi:hypothetical protein
MTLAKFEASAGGFTKLGRIADRGVHDEEASEEFGHVSRGCSIAVAPGPSC